jgi:hypothetical protein
VATANLDESGFGEIVKNPGKGLGCQIEPGRQGVLGRRQRDLDLVAVIFFVRMVL